MTQKGKKLLFSSHFEPFGKKKNERKRTVVEFSFSSSFPRVSKFNPLPHFLSLSHANAHTHTHTLSPSLSLHHLSNTLFYFPSLSLFLSLALVPLSVAQIILPSIAPLCSLSLSHSLSLSPTLLHSCFSLLVLASHHLTCPSLSLSLSLSLPLSLSKRLSQTIRALFHQSDAAIPLQPTRKLVPSRQKKI